MKTKITILIGAIIGALDGVGIFYAPGEPYKTEIFMAAILKGVLVSLIVAFTLKDKSKWGYAALIGILFGFLFAVVIFLAKGGFKSMDAPFVVPSGIIMGALTGILVNRFALRNSK